MDPLIGKFSIPFSGDNPFVFLEQLDLREKYVHDVYVGDANVFPQFRNVQLVNKTVVEDFLTCLQHKQRNWKLLFTINQILPDVKNTQQAIDLMQQYNVVDYLVRNGYDGAIVANPYVANALREMCPKLFLCSSVNTFTEEDEFPVFHKADLHVFDVYQVMRSDIFCIDEKKAKKIKQETGCKYIKVLINEACKRNCELLQKHIDNQTNKNQDVILGNRRRSMILCSDLVLPRWLDRLNYVDIFKLCGRPCSNEKLFLWLDSYISRKDVPIKALTGCVCQFNASEINTSVFSDEQLTCGNKCSENCKIKQLVYEKYKMLCRLYNHDVLPVL